MVDKAVLERLAERWHGKRKAPRGSPQHPGERLEKILDDLRFWEGETERPRTTYTSVAGRLGMGRAMLYGIMACKKPVMPTTALLLERRFRPLPPSDPEDPEYELSDPLGINVRVAEPQGAFLYLSAEGWLALQAKFDLWKARRELRASKAARLTPAGQPRRRSPGRRRTDPTPP